VTRLGTGTLPPGVAQPGYARAQRPIGIVHFGLGAFARAHLAWYTDAAMTVAGGDWMIAGVSLRSAEVAAQINPQHGLYTLAQRSGGGVDRRVIGSLAQVLVAPHDAPAIVELIAAPATRIVSFTVTEKGYCRAADGRLDLDQAAPGFYPLLAEALVRRRDAGLPGLTLLSCDNLADNGGQLARLMQAWLQARAPALADWFAGECRCPATMVDRIVPATTAEDLAEAQAALGCADAATVSTEAFSQWVIEDNFAGPRPAWDEVGAEIVRDVAPYEAAKLRMLNAAHSALAYLGLAQGHAFVHQAIADPRLHPLIARLLHDEAALTLAAAPGQDLDAYAGALLARFANPALNHRLIQIAMDGSQKIPQRWLATLAAAQAAGRSCPVILTALAAWLCHVRGDRPDRWGAVNDPCADQLAALWRRHGHDGIIDALFGDSGLIASAWHPTEADRAMINAAMTGKELP